MKDTLECESYQKMLIEYLITKDTNRRTLQNLGYLDSDNQTSLMEQGRLRNAFHKCQLSKSDNIDQKLDAAEAKKAYYP